MASVYLETSFISACVTDRTDTTSVHRQGISCEWWSTQRWRHELFVSIEVLNEVDHPSFPRRREALDLVEGVPLLAASEEVGGLAELLVREKVMPGPVGGDALHVAFATVHAVDYLLTWNVRHLANPSKITHLRTICLRAGFLPPQIVTPELLWEENNETI